MRLLEQARGCVEAAVSAEAISDGPLNSMERVVVWAAAVGGVLQLSHLGEYDVELFDGERLARQTTLDLFRAWGAEPGRLAAAVDASSGWRSPDPSHHHCRRRHRDHDARTARLGPRRLGGLDPRRVTRCTGGRCTNSPGAAS